MRRVLPVLSASKLALAEACAYAFVSVVDWPVTDSAASSFGRVVHAGAESYERADGAELDVSALAPAAAERAARCVAHLASWIDDHAPDHEVARFRLAEDGFRYNVRSGVAWRAPARGPEGYADIEPDVLPMTADIWWWAHPARPLVADYKTGRPKRSDELQIRSLALAISAITDAPEVDAVLLYVDEQGVRERRWTLDELDMAAHAEWLQSLFYGLGMRPHPVAGEHCTRDHCPLAEECPATRRTLELVAPTLPIGGITTHEEALRAYAGIPLAEAALEGVRKALQEYASRSALRLPDGRIYGLHPHVERRARPVTPELERAISEILGEHGAGVVRTEREITVGRLEGAAKALARARKEAGEAKTIAGEEARVMAALAEAGAFEIKEHVRLTARKPPTEKEKR